jgi:hypothetical protein
MHARGRRQKEAIAMGQGIRRFWYAGLVAVLMACGWLYAHSYPTLRSLAAAAERLQVIHDHAISTRHFLILYPAGEAAAARVVATEIEHDYGIESRQLGVRLSGRLTVVLYPNEAQLDESAGLPPQADDIGLYDAGTIRIAAPQSWITSADWRPIFQAEGPVAHELGHALLDQVANGNFPSWFNEGVAQEEDYRVTGYVWLTPTNSLSGQLYSMDRLNQNFYALPNQSLAYRQGLSLVQYLIAQRGQTTFDQFLKTLGQGTSFGTALHRSYGVSENGLYSAWRAWLVHTHQG